MSENRFILFLLALVVSNVLSSQGNSPPVHVGVPFLTITLDARAAGMGELGVATPPDAYSQQWNPAKYAFAEKQIGVGISYTPYLSKLVNDIFLGNLTGYLKPNDRSSWAASLRYFSLGDIQFNNFVGGLVVYQGIKRPNELTLDISYALKLSENFSMSVGGRFIHSDLKIATDSDTASANSLGVDIASYFQSNSFSLGENDAILRGGINISNIGPRLSYDVGGQKSFIPTNLKLGTGLDIALKNSNVIGIYSEFNKLLVPTPVATYDKNDTFLGYRQPDIDFLKGIFTSFGDAPGGFSEELKEITWALGVEYSFQNSVALRMGYFNESKEKGYRKYLTTGAGFNVKSILIDISYLFSTSKVQSPFENTIRFSVTFNLEKLKKTSSSDSVASTLF